MLEKKIAIDLITVTEDNSVQVRQVKRILEDGDVLSESFDRWVLSPGDDTSQQDAKVQAICNAVWALNG
jgi:hypothetical protein